MESKRAVPAFLWDGPKKTMQPTLERHIYAGEHPIAGVIAICPAASKLTCPIDAAGGELVEGELGVIVGVTITQFHEHPRLELLRDKKPELK